MKMMTIMMMMSYLLCFFLRTAVQMSRRRGKAGKRVLKYSERE